MERAPLPPHERTWRHPSELGPTRLDVEPDGHSRAAMLASGTLAVMVVAALVIARTPRPSSSPSALSAATTAPAAVSAVVATTPARDTDRVAVRLSSFTAIPGEIAAVPRTGPTDADGSPLPLDVLPDPDDDVVVLTDDHVYVVAWNDVILLDVSDGLVLSFDGALIAHLADGELHVDVAD